VSVEEMASPEGPVGEETDWSKAETLERQP
jgi:hypothetical protein